MDKEIQTLDQYIKLVNKICLPKDKLSFPNVFFRGEAEASWDIKASLFRVETDKGSYYKEANVKNEKDLIDAVKLQYPQVFEQCPDAISRMVIMKHYGLPTRWLDVTANPLVALYFACASGSDSDGKVLITKKPMTPIGNIDILASLIESVDNSQDVMDIKTLLQYCKYSSIGRVTSENSLQFTIRLFNDITQSFLFQPPYNNERIRRQRGAMIFSAPFELFDSKDLPKYNKLKRQNKYCEQILSMTFRKSGVILNNMFEKSKCIIKSRNKQRLLNELDLVGINEGYLFPELEHQFKTIKYQNIPKSELEINL